MAIAKAMLETGLLRTSSSSTVHNTLVGLNLRDKIKLGASGKIVSAFDIARVLVIGADWANPAQMDARHLVQRMSATEIRLFSQQHAFLKPDEVLSGKIEGESYARMGRKARADSFDAAPDEAQQSAASGWQVR